MRDLSFFVEDYELVGDTESISGCLTRQERERRRPFDRPGRRIDRAVGDRVTSGIRRERLLNNGSQRLFAVSAASDMLAGRTDCGCLRSEDQQLRIENEERVVGGYDCNGSARACGARGAGRAGWASGACWASGTSCARSARRSSSARRAGRAAAGASRASGAGRAGSTHRSRRTGGTSRAGRACGTGRTSWAGRARSAGRADGELAFEDVLSRIAGRTAGSVWRHHDDAGLRPGRYAEMQEVWIAAKRRMGIRFGAQRANAVNARMEAIAMGV